VLTEFCRQYGLPFRDLTLLKLALTHRSYLSVTGQGPRESNERLEFLGDSVLGLVTSEFLYRRHPDEHEGQLTKTKSLLVSKAILSRRALRIGLGRFVLMSHSEVESGGRQRLSILADAFESVIGAVYLDQGFEPARTFIHQHLLAESDAITSDKRHTNYKSHLQEYVQNAFRTHPVYRIRSEYGPDHSKHFMVEVMVGRRTLGEGRGHNKKEAEQAAARDALEKVERLRRKVREDEDREAELPRLPRARESAERDRPEERTERDREAEERPEREPRRDRDARQGAGRSPGPAAQAGPATPPTREPRFAIDEGVDDEPETEAGEPAAGRRRRRSRRGGRGRHGERHSEGAPPAVTGGMETPEMESAGEVGEAESAETFFTHRSEVPEQDDADVAAHRHELPESFELPTSGRRDEPLPAIVRAPAVEAPATERPRAFGRGRRRDPAPGAPFAPQGETGPPAGRGATPAPEPVAEERRVDVFTSSPPSRADATPPVLDVTPPDDDAAGQSNRERDARIEEMERALDSFGRRRGPDTGRKGRRR